MEELPLEKLLVQYEEGTKLVKICESNCRPPRSDHPAGGKSEGELATRPVTLEGEDRFMGVTWK